MRYAPCAKVSSIEHPATRNQHPMSKILGLTTFLGLQKSTAGMLFMVILVGMGERMAERFLPIIVTTFVFFTLFPLSLLFALSFEILVLAFILRGLKELGEPTRKALIMDLAFEGRKAAMFGLYYLMRDIIVSLAAFGGAFLWLINPQVNFLAAFAFGIVGTVSFALAGTDLTKDGGQSFEFGIRNAERKKEDSVLNAELGIRPPAHRGLPAGV